jgi:hypothetical protein
MALRIATVATTGLVLLIAASSASAVGQACTPAPNSDHNWEVALTQTKSQKAAKATLALVQKQSRAKGLKAVNERDCPTYEVAITGFRTKTQAAAAAKQAKAGFSHAALERT